MGAVVLDSPWLGQNFAPPTALDIETIETAVVNRLNAQITGIEIAHFPDQPEAYRMTHRVGAALVRYEGAEYGKLNDSGAVVQERRLKFEVTVMMRDLGWNTGGGKSAGTPGAYATMEAVRTALTGFRVPGCEKTHPLRERFVKRDKQGGTWIYAISFAMSTVAVESSTPDNFPLLTLARAQEKGGITAKDRVAAPYAFDSTGNIQLLDGNLAALMMTDSTASIVYLMGRDYLLDAVNGIVTRLASGTIAAGSAVRIAYTYADVVSAITNGGTAPTAPTN